jgi:tetratricopeptide (TPR) repeat protein
MSTASPGPAEGRPSWPSLLLVLAVAFGAQAGSLGGGWVLDDAFVVRDDPAFARGLAAIPGFFRGPAWHGEMESGAYRPIALASLALEAPLHRSDRGTLEPEGFRLANLLLHGLAAALFLSVLRRAAPGRGALALGAAVAFAAHPLVTGTVSAVVGRADLLALVFSLGAARLWLAYGEGRAAALPAAAVCLFLALLSKESAVGLPLALWLLDAGPLGLGPVGALRRRAAGHAALLAAVALFLLVLWPGPASPPPGVAAAGIGHRLLLGLEGMTRTALAVLLPVGLLGDRSDEAASRGGLDLGSPAGVAALVAALLVAVAALRGLRGRAGAASLAWLLFAALALPAAAVLPVGAPLEERAAYVVAPPLFLGLGLVAEALVGALARLPAWRAAAGTAAAAAALVALAGLSHARSRDWRDDEAFHEALLARDPLHVRAMIRLGGSLRRTAEEERRRASVMRSTDPAYGPLIESQKRHLAEAVERLRRAVERPGAREDVDAWAELGDALLAQGRAAEALQAYVQAALVEPALRLRAVAAVTGVAPRSRTRAARIYMGKARALESLGQLEGAAAAYASAVAWVHDEPTLLHRAGIAFCRVGAYAEGVPMLSDALDLTEDPEEIRRLQADLEKARRDAVEVADALLREAQAAQERGELPSRVAVAYERVLRADPRRLQAYVSAARLRGEEMGDFDPAYDLLDRAERMAHEVGGASEAAWLERIAEARAKVDLQRETAEEEERRDAEDRKPR